MTDTAATTTITLYHCGYEPGLAYSYRTDDDQQETGAAGPERDEVRFDSTDDVDAAIAAVEALGVEMEVDKATSGDVTEGVATITVPTPEVGRVARALDLCSAR